MRWGRICSAVVCQGRLDTPPACLPACLVSTRHRHRLGRSLYGSPIHPHLACVHTFSPSTQAFLHVCPHCVPRQRHLRSHVQVRREWAGSKGVTMAGCDHKCDREYVGEIALGDLSDPCHPKLLAFHNLLTGPTHWRLPPPLVPPSVLQGRRRRHPPSFLLPPHTSPRLLQGHRPRRPRRNQRQQLWR